MDMLATAKAIAAGPIAAITGSTPNITGSPPAFSSTQNAGTSTIGTPNGRLPRLGQNPDSTGAKFNAAITTAGTNFFKTHFNAAITLIGAKLGGNTVAGSLFLTAAQFPRVMTGMQAAGGTKTVASVSANTTAMQSFLHPLFDAMKKAAGFG